MASVQVSGRLQAGAASSKSLQLPDTLHKPDKQGGKPNAAGPAKPRKSTAKLLSGPPLDFSFKEISTLAEALYESAESGCAARPALVHVDPETPDVIPQPPPLPPRPHAIYNAVAVRLASNSISSLDGLQQFLEHVLDSPEQLAWLDLSCNKLEHIEDVLCTYPNLQVLYFHGNAISKLSEVRKLATLPKLSKLTLHGNPACKLPSYRAFVSATLPGLKSLDFGAFTKVERDEIAGWQRGHAKREAAR